MKKKNVNKLLALGLVSAMTAGMLAGCGNTASTTTDNGAADTTVTEATDDKTSTDTAKADNGEVPTLTGGASAEHLPMISIRPSQRSATIQKKRSV